MREKIELRPAYGRKVESLEELQDMWWCDGAYYAYCSIRDYKMMKKDFDIIILRGSNLAASAVFEKTIFTHVLAGNTSYI